MSSNEHLVELMCSLVDTEQSHFVQKPISLHCGHPICKNCIPVDRKQSIVCKKCEHVTDRDLSGDKESTPIKTLLKMCLPDLFAHIEKRFSDATSKLHCTTSSQDETIDLKAKYIEEEIEIRIESLKIELDELEVKLKQELARIIKEIKKDQTSDPRDEKESENYDKMLNELKNDLNSNLTKNEERFYYHQNNLKSLEVLLKKLTNEVTQNYQLQFIPADAKLSESAIGNVIFLKNDMKMTHDQIKQKLRDGPFTKFQLNSSPLGSCVIQNGNGDYFVTTGPSALSIYDKECKSIKVINRIGQQIINPTSVARNKRNELYISDNSHQVFMADADFNLIKSFGYQGNGSQAFKYPYEICCTNDYLFVSDHDNKRIQILDLDLEYVETIKLDCEPLTLQVHESTIGVCGNPGLYFYDLNTKQLKNKYADIGGRISLLNSYFYVMCCSPQKILNVYDKDGIFVESIDISRLNEHISSLWDGRILNINENLLVTSYNQKAALKF